MNSVASRYTRQLSKTYELLSFTQPKIHVWRPKKNFKFFYFASQTIQEKKASSDLKTILKTDFANLRFLELCLRQSLSINLNYIAWEKRLKLTWSKKKNHLCLKLYFVWYYFSRKRYPFRIPSIDEWYPFNIPCLELSSLLTAVKTLSFE